MKWDEDVYGLMYDLDVYMIVAVNNFNMGAMENKSLNIFICVTYVLIVSISFHYFLFIYVIIFDLYLYIC